MMIVLQVSTHLMMWYVQVHLVLGANPRILACCLWVMSDVAVLLWLQITYVQAGVDGLLCGITVVYVVVGWDADLVGG